MSKKSRRRNKRILGALLLGGLGLAAANRGKGVSADANDGFVDTEFKEQVVSNPVTTKTTVMDSMPARPKKNQLSKRIKKNTNKVYTIKDVKEGTPPKVGNTNSIFKGDDGYLRRGENATPMTTGRFGTYRADQEMKRGALPPQLRVPRASTTYSPGNDGLSYFKKGGRVKGCGKALRGFGRAMKRRK